MTARALKSGEIYRIEGPAKVTVRQGRIYATGVVYTEGQSFTVLKARRLAIKALADSDVEFILGPGAVLERAAPGEEVLDRWDEKTSSLDLRGVIMVVGMVDVGKSTMAALLGNKALARGLSVAIVDADVGQNDLGPPTTVSLARLTRYITHLRQLLAERSVFLQATSLERIWQSAVEKIARAVEYAINEWGADTVIVNTDGWVLDKSAVLYKRALIDRIKPNLIVAIQVEGELAPILDGYSNVVVVPPPPHARARSREDRKAHREMGYGRFIFPPVELVIHLNKTPLCNLPMFGGIEISDELKRMLGRALGVPILKAFQYKDRVYAIVNSDSFAVRKIGGFKVACLPADFERGLLVGLEDGEGFLVGLGVIKKIYYDKRKAIVYTSGEVEKNLNRVRCVRLGLVRLDESFNEAEKAVGLLKILEADEGEPGPPSNHDRSRGSSGPQDAS
jgi:polynucleotide 5'-hydroxyl-kinase GRC3/NOL9